VDRDRVYATGLSNGGAITYRLACERASVFAAVAPVGTGDQLGAAQGCTPARPVPVLHTHGTADPCWTFETGTTACIQDDGGRKVGVEDTLARWRTINGCKGDPVETTLPDGPGADDGTRTRRFDWSCAADTTLLQVEGGGHTWPGGWQYWGSHRIGPVAQDFDLDELLVPWLLEHRLGGD
jgi:polyhydroxybutyrate depolymerase